MITIAVKWPNQNILDTMALEYQCWQKFWLWMQEHSNKTTHDATHEESVIQLESEEWVTILRLMFPHLEIKQVDE